jgi:lysophospholipase L1-like esterase
MKILLLGSSIVKHWKNFAMHEESINMGKSGLVTSNLVSYLEKIPPMNSEYIVLYCGGNDVVQNVDKNAITNNILLGIEHLSKRFPKSIIIIISLLKSPSMKDKIAEIDYINNNVRKYTKTLENVTCINVNRELSNPKYFQKDGMHLNTPGYEKMNNKLYTFLYNNGKT